MIARFEHLQKWAWLIFPILALGFFCVPIIRGLVLVPGDILARVDSVWTPTAAAHNPLLSDVLLQFYPWQKFLFDQLNHGTIPLWNPYVLTGTPFLANDQSAVFEPIRLVLFALRVSAAHAFLWLAIIRLSLIGIFTWLFFRGRGFGRVAYVAGALMMFSAPVIAWLAYPLVWVFVWLPLLLYATDQMMSGRRWGWTLVILSTAAQALSGNIQMSLFILGVALAYVLAMHRPFRWTGHGWWALAVALGLGVAMIQLLPAFSFIRQSTTYDAGRRGYATAGWSAFGHAQTWFGWTSLSAAKKNIQEILPVVAPFINGSPAANNYRYPGGDVLANFNELSGSIGWLGFCLAIVGIIWGWRERLVKFATGLSVVCVGMIIHAPVFEVLNYLPLLNRVETGRLRFVLVFGLVTLAVVGLRELMGSKRRRPLLVLTGLSVIEIILMSMLEPAGTRITDMILTLGAMAMGAITLYFVKQKNLQTGLVGLAAILPLFVLLFGYNTAVTTNELYPPTAVTTALQQLDLNHRFVGWSSAATHVPLMPNAAMVFGLHDVRGYEVVRLRRYDELTSDVLLHSGSSITRVDHDASFLSLAGISTIVVGTDDQDASAAVTASGGTAAAVTAGATLYQSASSMSRAYVATSFTLASSPAQARQLARSVSPLDPPVIEGAPQVPTIAFQRLPATITAETANTLTVEATATAPSYLIIADAYDAGWRASVDGVATPIYAADYAFRAVPLTPGTHHVVFRYQPSSYTVGQWITLGSIVVAIGFGFFSARSSRRRPN